MLWKFLGLQRLFDELLDERWFSFDLPDNECFAYEELPLSAQD